MRVIHLHLQLQNVFHLVCASSFLNMINSKTVFTNTSRSHSVGVRGGDVSETMCNATFKGKHLFVNLYFYPCFKTVIMQQRGEVTITNWSLEEGCFIFFVKCHLVLIHQLSGAFDAGETNAH